MATFGNLRRPQRKPGVAVASALGRSGL